MTFLSFVFFGSAPLIPYVLMDPVPRTFGVSVFATFSALTALGLLRWKVTSQTLVRCVGETVLVGGICAAVAFAVGLAIAQ
jgi:VIT1/CCC1 family predicted Fe2+/Mn2+ transporter